VAITNPTILRAIAIQESGGRPDAIHVNADGSVDRGMFQINSIHLKELGQYGISAAHLNDPCAASYVAAWHLKRQMDIYGNTWDAVGAYHSRANGERQQYAARIRAIVTAILAQAAGSQ
jgi:soluble lytic murein transglycosylase-like protein